MIRILLMAGAVIAFAGCSAVMESSMPKNEADSVSKAPSFEIPPENWWIVIRKESVRGSFSVNGRSRQLRKGKVNISIKEIFARTELNLDYGAVKQKGEGSFYYPIPGDASVNDFIMTVGERKIRAVIMSEKEASVIYTAALKRGLKARVVTRRDFDEMLINTAVAAGETVTISFSFKSILRYSEEGFVYSLAPLEKASGAEVSFKADVKSDFEIKEFNGSIGEKRRRVNSIVVIDKSDRSLVDGFQMKLKLGEESFCCQSKKGDSYAVWDGESKTLRTGFGGVDSALKTTVVPGESVNVLAAHNAICQKLREGAASEEIVSFALRYKMLTPLTSYLVVDALKK